LFFIATGSNTISLTAAANDALAFVVTGIGVVGFDSLAVPLHQTVQILPRVRTLSTILARPRTLSSLLFRKRNTSVMTGRERDAKI
jgi:hypothetical protein